MAWHGLWLITTVDFHNALEGSEFTTSITQCEYNYSKRLYRSFIPLPEAVNTYSIHDTYLEKDLVSIIVFSLPPGVADGDAGVWKKWHQLSNRVHSEL